MKVGEVAGGLRTGRVRGRYFRENYAQGGFDLVQIIPELVTNSDAAIAASGRERGRIEISLVEPEPELAAAWEERVKALRVPALQSWRWEIRCTDDGEGVNAGIVDERLGALGELPESEGQRGLFGRGLRDVWLAQGGGRIQGINDGRAVESWFFPAAGDDPYVYLHILDAKAKKSVRQHLGLKRGSRVAVPLAVEKAPAATRLRSVCSGLVQLRPVLEDPQREVILAAPGELPIPITYSSPEPDPERPVLYDDAVQLPDGIEAQITVRRAAAPIPASPARALRRGGLAVCSGRAVHEATLGSFEGRPGARYLFGEIRCEAIEVLQRSALESPRPDLVVKVDRSGLNENHPVVKALYAALDRILRPLVEAEERRAGAHLRRAGREIQARDQVGLRALNQALRSAFDSPGRAGFEPGGNPSERAAHKPLEDAGERASRNGNEPIPAPAADPLLGAPMRFSRSPLRMHPGGQRSVSLMCDPARLSPGTEISVDADSGIGVWLPDRVPEPGTRGWSRATGTLRTRANAKPGARLTVLAEAAGHVAELQVLVVRHRAHGWVREIARKEVDSTVEAEFDPETGVVTVYEGRREFRVLERAARVSGLSKRRAPEYLPYRMLEVEAAANAVYRWAAERIVERRETESRPANPIEYSAAVHLEAQSLRHLHHEKLMRAFLAPEVFEGQVSVESRVR